MTPFKLQWLGQNAADVLRTITIVFVAPTIVFVIGGAFLFMQRPLANIDYFLLFLLVFPFSIRASIFGLCVLLFLDFVFALAPAFHFSLASVLESVSDVFALDPIYLISEAAKVLVVLVLFGSFTKWVAQSIKSIQVVVVTCVALTAGTVVLDQVFSLGTIRAEKMPFGNPNIAGSTVNDMRIAVETASQRSMGPLELNKAPSASEEMGLWRESGTHRPDVFLVLVESLGHLDTDEAQRFQWAHIDALDNLPGITITRGTVPFQGSTVPGELRELCGLMLMAVHPMPEAIADLDCLPRRLSAMGYTTKALHGFSGTLFSRKRWYPALSFDQVLFAPELLAYTGADKRCGLAFRGTCDTDVWAAILDEQSTEIATPQFVYWLTLTAHLPTEPASYREINDCERISGLEDSASTCALVSQHLRLFQDIARSIKDGLLSNSRILLVGDHAPPFIEHNARSRFDPHSVPFALIDIE